MDKNEKLAKIRKKTHPFVKLLRVFRVYYYYY